MAEIIVSSLFQAVFDKLADEGLKKLARSQGIYSELKELGTTLSHIQALLNDASHKEISDESVKKWLNSLQHLAYDIDDVLDDLATDVMHQEFSEQSGAITGKVRKLVPTCCTNFSLSHRLSPKLDDITIKLQNLEKQKLSLGLTVKDEKAKYTSRRNETSLPDGASIVGRHNEKEKLLQKLLGNEDCDRGFSVIPIVGMGGVGKTTLARLLYNETQVPDHFKLKGWVCVSDDFDVFKLSKTIFQELTKENKKFDNLNQLQMALTEELKGKRFLLVLDDVWSENCDDWENLVRPLHSGAPGSKIIMTTRKEKLLKKLGYDNIDHLASLSHDDALSLFALHSLGVDNFDSDPTLKPFGAGIVKKCGGLPLALKALGRLLRGEKDEERWEEVLNSDIWDLENRDEIVPALRLSYQDLPACLKQLFAYCSLFPKDFVFDKEDLVLLWMAEGFLNQTSGNKSAERLGQEYLEMLLSRSFFQEVPNEKSSLMMHDLMNDLATFVAGEYFLRFANHTEIEKEALAKYHHMSFLREKYVAYQKFEVFKKASSVRTFIAVSVGVLRPDYDIFYLSKKILVDLLPELQLLRVLCLSYSYITEVPEFIGSLKHLRYLNLSQTNIAEIPEKVCNLYNLQTLMVFGCYNLSKLPNSFLKLKRLRHFDIRGTPLLKKMPFGIGVLKSLQTLTKIIIGGGDDRFSITGLKDLKNLHGKLSIEGLDKVQSSIHARESNASLTRLTELELKWGDVFDDSRKETLEKEVLNELKPATNKLKKLGIVSYGGIEFPNWVGDPSFCKLVHVSIRGCSKCTSLPTLGQLPLLKELFIEGMSKVKVIGSELLGTTGVAFPSLESLRFEDMSEWEVWSTRSVDDVFPSLQKLVIAKCPNLVDISLEALPSLSVLTVSKCGEGVLRCLVRVASSITKLNIEWISGLTDEVWRSVIEYLGAVEEVKLKFCEEIRYLWESKAKVSKVLVNLRKLEVSECPNLVSLGEKEEDEDNFESDLLTSLTILDVSFCDSMERCCCPSSIESLSIMCCSSLTSVSFPTATEDGQKLKSLDVSDCPKLTEKISNTNMPMLENVFILNWPSMKSITELSCSIHLTDLQIYNCPSIESFPDLQRSNLTSLKHLAIKNCPNMDASFPRGHWPPKLSSLGIGGLKKSISEWDPQNFPISLVELRLYDEHVSNFSELSYLLPSSLTLLHITEFKNLEFNGTPTSHVHPTSYNSRVSEVDKSTRNFVAFT